MKIKLQGFNSSQLILVNGKSLDPRKSQSVYNHSPDGFSWGYGGSGPSQLALAILLDFTERATALANYQRFKWDVIALLPSSDFCTEVDLTPYIGSKDAASETGN